LRRAISTSGHGQVRRRGGEPPGVHPEQAHRHQLSGDRRPQPDPAHLQPRAPAAGARAVCCGCLPLHRGVVFAVALFKFRLIQWLEPYGLSPIGKGVGAGMQAVSILVFNKGYQSVLKWLTDYENWQKPTEICACLGQPAVDEDGEDDGRSHVLAAPPLPHPTCTSRSSTHSLSLSRHSLSSHPLSLSPLFQQS